MKNSSTNIQIHTEVKYLADTGYLVQYLVLFVLSTWQPEVPARVLK